MEDKDQIIITVAGKVASGKSTITYLLKKFLRENGFDVELKPSMDHPNENHFDRYIGKNIEQKTQSVSERRKIVLSEVQLKRDAKFN
jgi:uridine kinase